MTDSRFAVHVPNGVLNRFVGKSPRVKGKEFLFTCKQHINGLRIILFCKGERGVLAKGVEGVSKRVGRRHYKLAPIRQVPLQELSSMKLVEVA